MFNKINISPSKQILTVYIFLTLITLAVLGQVNQFNFINFDDNVYVTQNSHVQAGISADGVRWAFGTIHAEFWHPLTWLSLMFDYQLYGPNASGFHLTNLILHILSTLLLFWLFNRMTGAVWRSAFVAALFALHPLHVESVAWIAERKDVLSAFFWMLTLCLYVYYTEKPVIKRYLLVVFGFACALMSKSMVVTLPVIMILLDYWPLKRFESQKRKKNPVLWQLKEKIPLLVLSAISSMITIYAQYNPAAKKLSLGSRLAEASVAYATYLEKTFWPHGLAVCYSFWDQLSFWRISGSMLLILVISFAVIITVKRLPSLCVGWLWYLITLLPVTGIINVRVEKHTMADRFTYLPLIGIGIMLAWGIPLLMKHEAIRKKILFPAAISVLAVLSVLTWHQCGYWKNSVDLFSHTLRVTRDNYKAHNNLAAALAEEGKTDDAIDNYNKAIQIKPDYADAYNNRGNVFATLGQHQRAIEDYSAAIRLQSDYVYAYYNRGIAYFRYGENKSGCGDAKKACELGDCKILEIAQDNGFCR
ncbi:MAG: hypothetical protein CVU55_09170 [Deltaproteobacteria bacterium HGW-Deltaproteobacteria-13]|jgi:tetratricopeptide (TPR) repeat protein|nr:MAG: hypothetical protein CVU55_09170 [Deltaproteobacteria bacterium HGW-Deltaproteobacteria-13]